MRQPRRSDDVAGGVDSRHIGFHFVVDHDEALLVDPDPGCLEAKPTAARLTPYRYQNPVEVQGFLGAALAVLEGHRQAALGFLVTQGLGAGLELDSPLI